MRYRHMQAPDRVIRPADMGADMADMTDMTGADTGADGSVTADPVAKIRKSNLTLRK